MLVNAVGVPADQLRSGFHINRSMTSPPGPNREDRDEEINVY